MNQRKFELMYYYPWRYNLGLVLIVASIFIVFLVFMEIYPVFDRELYNFSLAMLVEVFIFVGITKFMVTRCQLIIADDSLKLYSYKADEKSVQVLDIPFFQVLYFKMIFQRGQKILKLKILRKGVIMFNLRNDNYTEIYNLLRDSLPGKEIN